MASKKDKAEEKSSDAETTKGLKLSQIEKASKKEAEHSEPPKEAIPEEKVEPPAAKVAEPKVEAKAEPQVEAAPHAVTEAVPATPTQADPQPPGQDKPAEAAAANPKPEEAASPAAPPAVDSGDKAAPVVPTAESSKPTKPKKFHLPFFKKKSKDKASESEVSKQVINNKPVSVVDVVNAIDSDIKLDVHPSVEDLAKQLDDQIEQVSAGDVVTVKLPKKKLISLLGITLLVMWLVPLVGLVGPKILGLLPINKPEAPGDQVPVDEASQSAQIKVRVKHIQTKAETAQKIADELKSLNYDFIEVVEDSSQGNGVEVVIKPGSEGLWPELSTLLAQYSVSSSSATLDQDSDFNAVILVQD